jgi:hypothetical protein
MTAVASVEQASNKGDCVAMAFDVARPDLDAERLVALEGASTPFDVVDDRVALFAATVFSRATFALLRSTARGHLRAVLPGWRLPT